MQEIAYNFCNGALALGIYTDTESAAYDLASSFGHTPELQKHWDGENAGLGEFYNHYHIYGKKGAHVWFGTPTAIKLF